MQLVVVGDIAWDIFIRPEHDLVRGSDVFGTVDIMPGGAAANVAVWSRRLGLPSVLCAKIGDDTLGQVMLAHLRQEGLDAGVTVVPGGLTTRVGILVSSDGEHSFVIDHTKNLIFAPGDVSVSVLDGASALFFNAYDILLSRSTSYLAPVLAAARRRGIPLIFDPSSFALIRKYGAARLLEDLGPLDVIIANEDEARALAPEVGLHGLLQHTPLLVVKRGADGAAALTPDGWVREPAVPIDVVDTTGAGDAFDAAFVRHWLETNDVPAALRAANRLGAYVARSLGGQPPAPTTPDAALRDLPVVTT